MISVCVWWRERGLGGGRERPGEISDSLIKDVSKTLIKIEYPCKCKATCNLQVFHLEQLSQYEAVFYVCLHCTQIDIPFSFYFSPFAHLPLSLSDLTFALPSLPWCQTQWQNKIKLSYPTCVPLFSKTFPRFSSLNCRKSRKKPLGLLMQQRAQRQAFNVLFITNMLNNLEQTLTSLLMLTFQLK